jgi:hypothetical protein
VADVLIAASFTESQFRLIEVLQKLMGFEGKKKLSSLYLAKALRVA